MVSDAKVEELIAKLQLCAPVTKRSMFGGYGLFIEGVMFGLVADGQPFFKGDGQNLEQYKLAGSKPFEYDRKGKPIQMSYYAVPDWVLEDVRELSDWVESARLAAIRSKAKKR